MSKLVCGPFTLQNTSDGTYIFGTLRTQGDWKNLSEGSEALGKALAVLKMESLGELKGLKAVLIDGDTVNFTFPLPPSTPSQQIIAVQKLGETIARKLHISLDRSVSTTGIAL